jgi:hypothetical protein
MDKNTNYQAFTKAVAWLHNLYPQAAMRESTVDAWWNYLQHLPWDAVRKAVIAAPSKSKEFCPTAPLILDLKMIEGISQPLLDDNNEFEQLARSWETESAELGIAPNEPLPANLHARRLGELSKRYGVKNEL